MLTEEKLRHNDAVSDKLGGRGNEGGRRAAARELGVSEPAARRAEKIASSRRTPTTKRPVSALTAQAAGVVWGRLDERFWPASPRTPKS